MSETISSEGFNRWGECWRIAALTVLNSLSSGFSATETITPPAEPHDCVFATFQCGGALTGTARISVSPTDAVVLATLLMGENARNSDQASAEEREAALEFLRQVAGHAATSASQRWNAEVQLNYLETPPSTGATAATLSITITGPHSFSLTMEVDAELSAKLSGDSVNRAPAEAAATRASSTDSNLNLLLDLGLEVRLRFGQREMSLRDMLELGPGTVVELDRRVEEPVELLVGERVFARGDVVIVDGNYGLHVTEVAPERRRSPRSCAA